jgi:hypothetical protein
LKKPIDFRAVESHDVPLWATECFEQLWDSVPSKGTAAGQDVGSRRSGGGHRAVTKVADSGSVGVDVAKEDGLPKLVGGGYPPWGQSAN